MVLILGDENLLGVSNKARSRQSNNFINSSVNEHAALSTPAQQSSIRKPINFLNSSILHALHPPRRKSFCFAKGKAAEIIEFSTNMYKCSHTILLPRELVLDVVVIYKRTPTFGLIAGGVQCDVCQPPREREIVGR